MAGNALSKVQNELSQCRERLEVQARWQATHQQKIVKTYLEEDGFSVVKEDLLSSPL